MRPLAAAGAVKRGLWGWVCVPFSLFRGSERLCVPICVRLRRVQAVAGAARRWRLWWSGETLPAGPPVARARFGQRGANNG